VQDTYRAVYGKLDPLKRLHGFEVFGYDFMIDEDFRIYLIEVNTNPCLETSCSLLARIISELLDNTFRLAFDPLFFKSLTSTVVAAPSQVGKNPVNQADTSITMFKYELVFDEELEGEYLREKVLPKTLMAAADHVFLQDDEEEELNAAN